MSTPLRLGVFDCGISIASSLLPICSSCSCNGDGCEAIDPWPIHQVRLRNIGFLRLCTSCVLKHHPGSFCCSCFEFLNSYEHPPLAQCLKCPSVVHVCCLPDPSLAPVFLCPSCEIPSTVPFSYFSYSKNSINRAFDLRASKVLLIAARIAAASMSRAVALAKSDAEKKVKEAALARKRARDMLESALVISKKDKMYFVESAAASSTDTAEVEISGPKKKASRPSSAATTIVAHKRAKNRNREKWMRFSESFELVQKGTQRSDSGTEDGNKKVWVWSI
ncbi:hypothetical protein HPP92_012367 [Vanilla planifolia]|uniref:Uncharacterized protein n=1 Tax=Vanilla planifolia TaxID=51239 RepID=A0A835R0A0_VANPL|nr:hypothetical protein HPP92_012367 [Vanilla planifolia]